MSGSNRKFGRCKNRPSNKAYTQNQRWVSNKAKAIKRTARVQAKKAIRRINYLIRKGQTTIQAQAERLQVLRHLVSQNLTG